VGGFRVFCSTNLLISASTDESNFSAPAEDDVGAFIRFSVTGLASSPNPGRYFQLVNNCLGTPHPNLSGAGGLAATAGPLTRPPAGPLLPCDVLMMTRLDRLPRFHPGLLPPYHSHSPTTGD